MVSCCGRGPVQNGSPRLEGISPVQRQMEGFNDGGVNSLRVLGPYKEEEEEEEEIINK